MNLSKYTLGILTIGLLSTACSNDDDNGTTDPTDLVSNIPTVTEVITGDDFTRDDNGDYNNDYINNYTTLFTRDGNTTVSFSGQTTRLKQAVEIGKNLKTQTEVADIQLKFEGLDGESTKTTTNEPMSSFIQVSIRA